MIYGLATILIPLCLLIGVGALAARREPSDDETRRMRTGAIAGFFAGATAAVLLTVFTIGTMLLFPGHVDLLWANPDPNVARGTAYEVQMSVGDASIKYQAALLIGPIVGLVLGAIGGTAAPRGTLSSGDDRSPVTEPIAAQGFQSLRALRHKRIRRSRMRSWRDRGCDKGATFVLDIWLNFVSIGGPAPSRHHVATPPN